MDRLQRSSNPYTVYACTSIYIYTYEARHPSLCLTTTVICPVLPAISVLLPCNYVLVDILAPNLSISSPHIYNIVERILKENPVTREILTIVKNAERCIMVGSSC